MKALNLLAISVVIYSFHMANAQSDSSAVCDAHPDVPQQVTYSGDAPLVLKAANNPAPSHIDAVLVMPTGLGYDDIVSVVSDFGSPSYVPDRVWLTASIPETESDAAARNEVSPFVRIRPGTKLTITGLDQFGSLMLESPRGIKFRFSCSTHYVVIKSRVPGRSGRGVSTKVRPSLPRQVECTKEALERHFNFTSSCTEVEMPINYVPETIPARTRGVSI